MVPISSAGNAQPSWHGWRLAPSFTSVKRKDSRPVLSFRETADAARGELHKWYLGEWRQKYLVKTPDDYRILRRAFEDTQFVAADEPFLRSETALGNGGMTVGQIGRTPLMQVQIDLAGLERSSLDLADEHAALMELLDLMADLLLRQFREAVKTPVQYIKLWENLSIETIGRRQYERHLMPLYRKILELLDPAGKRLLVHYDGKLRLVADDIAGALRHAQ
jgi:hypothetical protein